MIVQRNRSRNTDKEQEHVNMNGPNGRNIYDLARVDREQGFYAVELHCDCERGHGQMSLY